MNHADHARPGVIFGFRTLGDFGEYSDGQGHMYYFGRTKQKCFLELPLTGEEVEKNQKEMLKTKGRHNGLNAPSRMLMWVRVKDIDMCWEDFRVQLRGWLRTGVAVKDEPIITNHLWVGDNFYTVENVGPADFGKWCRATMDRIIKPARVFRIDVEV